MNDVLLFFYYLSALITNGINKRFLKSELDTVPHQLASRSKKVSSINGLDIDYSVTLVPHWDN